MQLVIDIPDAVVAGRSEAELAAQLSLLAVLDAFRRGDISSGRAARLLGLTRVAFYELAGSRGVPVMNYGVDDLERELAGLDTLGR